MNHRGTLEHQLARLADGELNPAQSELLLKQLDEEPDGWRQCALVLLEEQSLRREMRALMPPPVLTAPAPAVPRGFRGGTRWLALAASFALCFLAGAAVGPTWRDLLTLPAQGPTEQMAQSDARPTPLEAVPSSTPAEQPPQLAERSSPLTDLQLVIHQGQEEVKVPVYDNPEAARQAMRPILPSELVQQWQREGHTVYHRQDVVSLDLPDGRKVIVPVHQLEIVPVHSRPLHP